jgi:hypothetical protein
VCVGIDRQRVMPALVVDFDAIRYRDVRLTPNSRWASAILIMIGSTLLPHRCGRNERSSRVESSGCLGQGLKLTPIALF